jgi:molecular chaperone DnaJ
VLGVPRDADAKTIREAFRGLALRYHPDRNKEPGAEERFKEIAEAYAVLSDPKKRADYDAGGFAGVAGFTPEDLFGGIDFESIFGGLGFGQGGGLFERLFRHAGPPRGADIEIELAVPLATIARGGEQRVRYERLEVCPACGGSGAKAGTAPRVCAACNGTGEKVTTRREQGMVIRQSRICPECHGTGRVIDEPCPACAGRGRLPREESLVITIPPGAEEGLVLRVAGKGYASEEPGGVAGNLHVVVRSAPDARFQRDGADLWHEERIDVVDAVLGTELRVPTLDGALAVKIPPGTQPGAPLRLRGKGLPRFGARGRGDLYLRLVFELPARLDSEERKLWEQLRAVHRGR